MFDDEKLNKLGWRPNGALSEAFRQEGLMCEYIVPANSIIDTPRIVFVNNTKSEIRVNVRTLEDKSDERFEPAGLLFEELLLIYEMFFGVPRCDDDIIEESSCSFNCYGKHGSFNILFDKQQQTK